MSDAPLGIGSTIWIFNINNRRYEKGHNAPVYRGHWQPYVITGETSRSWLLENGLSKVTKKNPGTNIAFTEKEVDDDCWLNSNRMAISRVLERCTDAALVRQIGDMLGYKEKAT